MNTPLEPAKFLEIYGKYVSEVLTPTRNELDCLFQKWIHSDWSWHSSSHLPAPSPIYLFESRIKPPESVVDKIILDRLDVFPGKLCLKSLRTMNDTVAGRIIVYFLSNMSLVHDAIMGEKSLEISKKNPPIAFLAPELIQALKIHHVRAEPKKSGYSAIHYIVKLNDSAVDPDQRPWLEIQLKTLTEHVWGEIEHLLGYKPEKVPSENIKKQFQIISKHLSAIDEHFNLLFEDLTRVQEEKKYTGDDLLNFENLPAVLNAVGLGCSQREVGRILKILDSRGISHVNELLDLATQNLLTTIRNTYRSYSENEPTNSEIIASLAAVKGIRESSQIIEAVKTQINFHRASEALKGE